MAISILVSLPWNSRSVADKRAISPLSLSIVAVLISTASRFCSDSSLLSSASATIRRSFSHSSCAFSSCWLSSPPSLFHFFCSSRRTRSLLDKSLSHFFVMFRR